MPHGSNGQSPEQQYVTTAANRFPTVPTRVAAINPESRSLSERCIAFWNPGVLGDLRQFDAALPHCASSALVMPEADCIHDLGFRDEGEAPSTSNSLDTHDTKPFVTGGEASWKAFVGRLNHRRRMRYRSQCS